MDVWSDKKRQNQERTHPRNDESSAGVQKDNGEKTEIVWARHEDGRRSRSEESDDESDTGEKEERETKNKVEGSYLPTIPDSPELLRKSASNFGITARGKIITEIVDYGNLVTSGNNW